MQENGSESLAPASSASGDPMADSALGGSQPKRGRHQPLQQQCARPRSLEIVVKVEWKGDFWIGHVKMLSFKYLSHVVEGETVDMMKEELRQILSSMGNEGFHRRHMQVVIGGYHMHASMTLSLEEFLRRQVTIEVW